VVGENNNIKQRRFLEITVGNEESACYNRGERHSCHEGLVQAAVSAKNGAPLMPVASFASSCDAAVPRHCNSGA
jgi:hypothetical protein